MLMYTEVAVIILRRKIEYWAPLLVIDKDRHMMGYVTIQTRLHSGSWAPSCYVFSFEPPSDTVLGFQLRVASEAERCCDLLAGHLRWHWVALIRQIAKIQLTLDTLTPSTMHMLRPGLVMPGSM